MSLSQSDLIEEVSRLSGVAGSLAEEIERLRACMAQQTSHASAMTEEIRTLRALEQAVRDYMETFSADAWCRLRMALKDLDTQRGKR